MSSGHANRVDARRRAGFPALFVVSAFFLFSAFPGVSAATGETPTDAGTDSGPAGVRDPLPPLFGASVPEDATDAVKTSPPSGTGDAPEPGETLPSYDPLRYCSMLSGLVEDVEEARRKCLLKEEEARIRLEGLTLPDDVLSECDTVARSLGGSYLVLLGCVEDRDPADPADD